MLKVIVCGGRDYGWVEGTNRTVRDQAEVAKLCETLDAFAYGDDESYGGPSEASGTDERWNPSLHLTVIHGAASGADQLAGAWARANGIRELAEPADWKRHGKAAGFIRNKAMLDMGPDYVIAFPGGRGTAMMVEIARRAGVEVKEVK